MPHQRKRLLLEVLNKRLKLFPVVGVLGARQTGKSTLIRELLAKTRKIEYVTLDRTENKNRALSAPTLFLQSFEGSNSTLCIDEAQKAPVLFDTIKAEVDEAKRPGRYLLTGSTEFSKKTGVRESLTGRIALLRLYPMTVREANENSSIYPIASFCKRLNQSPIALKEIKRWMELGGMPGICFVREEHNRQSLLESWIETTCLRDLANFNIPRFNPDLAQRILFAIASSEIPNKAEIARTVGKLPRQIENYIEGFKALHVVYEIESLPSGTGKSLFYLFDSGIAKRCGADEHRRLQIWFINECLSQWMNSGQLKPNLLYYQTAKGSRVDFVVSDQKKQCAFMLSEEESPSTYYLRTAEAFSKKHPSTDMFILNPGVSPYRLTPKIRILPWSSVV